MVRVPVGPGARNAASNAVAQSSAFQSKTKWKRVSKPFI